MKIVYLDYKIYKKNLKILIIIIIIDMIINLMIIKNGLHLT